MATNKRKSTTAIVAGVTALALLLGGTFAWTSISQQARNEAIVDINPGGRLHDDFNGTNKDVYVENFGDALTGVDIFARIRLDQYFEVGQDAGKNKTESNRKVDIKLGTDINKEDTWVPYKPLDTNGEYITIGSEVSANTNWKWQLGNDEDNKPIYLPTFNMNKDSLEADVNGTYEGTVEGDIVHYDDYKLYEEKAYIGTEVHDWDEDTNEEDGGVKAGAWDNGGIITDETKPINSGDVLHKENQPHTAQPISTTATVISMEEWINDYDMELGDFWVYDQDGWAYWANPIAPGKTTGLLLDGIEMSRTPDDNWYYAINVVGQFATASDVYEFENMTEEATKLVDKLTGKVEMLTLTLDNWTEPEVYAPVGTPVRIEYDPRDYTNEEDENAKLEGVDISVLTMTYSVWDDEIEDSVDYELSQEQYTYSNNILTIIDPDLEGNYVYVESSDGSVWGYLYCFEDSEGGDSPEITDKIDLYHDGNNDTFSGGEWFIFTADVYDENGERIAITSDVTFKLTDQDGNELTQSDVAAASVSGFTSTYMKDNNLFIADNILDSEITELTVTATYTVPVEEGSEAEPKTYKETYTLTREGAESPLVVSMTWNGKDYTAQYNSFWVRTQTFANRTTFNFSAKFNGETAKNVTWAAAEEKDDANFGFVISDPDEDGWITLFADDRWTAEATSWQVVDKDTPIAKLNQNTGVLELLLDEDLIPGNLPINVTATVDGVEQVTMELFLVYHPVEFSLVNADVEDSNSLEAREAVFNRDAVTTINVKPILSVKEEEIEVNADTLKWYLCYGEMPDGEPVDDGWTITPSEEDDVWILTIPANIKEDEDALRLEAQFMGTKYPFEEDGIYTSYPLEISASDKVSVGIDTLEISGDTTYESGAYVKVPLEATALDNNGDEVWGAINWALIDAPANVQIKYSEGGSTSAEVWILGATEDIKVRAMFSNYGDTELLIDATYTLTPAAAEGEEEPVE